MRGLSLAFFLGLAASPALGDMATDVISRLLTTPPEEAQFAPAFLTAIPMTDIAALLQDLRATIGPPTDIRVTGEAMLVTTATHRLRGQIGLDSEGRITLLYADPPELLVNSLDQALPAIRALGTETAWLVTRDGVPLASEGADRPMAVGSAFKLGVLAVLAEDVQGGLRRWDDVVVLNVEDISLPSGILQGHPPGAPMTLHTAAALMISLSDNTATDLLIRTLGRDRIAAKLGLDPLLTTREFFALKANPDAEAAYLAAAPAERAALATATAAAGQPAASQIGTTLTPGIEWHVSLTRLCALAVPLADQPVLSIDPGPVPAEDWDRVAYKGGSTPGVLNFTAVLRDASDHVYCVAMSVNSQRDVDLMAAIAAFRGVLDGLLAPG